MAITYPRSLPSTLVIPHSKFDLKYQVGADGRTRGGGVQMTEFADPYWEAKIGSTKYRAGDFITLKTWVHTLRGGQKTYLAHDQARPRPMFYPTDAAILALTRGGGGSFDGTASITQFPDAYSITFGNSGALRLPSNFQFLAGDYLSMIHTGSPNNYGLHQITEDAVASGGGTVTVSVIPAVKTNIFAVADVCNFIKPLGEFVLVQDNVEGEPDTNASEIYFTGRSRVS